MNEVLIDNITEIEKSKDKMIEVCLRHKATGYKQTLSGKLIAITPEQISISEDFLRKTYYTDAEGKRRETYVDTTEVTHRKFKSFDVVYIKILTD